jgi:hypothetical protein
MPCPGLELLPPQLEEENSISYSMWILKNGFKGIASDKHLAIEPSNCNTDDSCYPRWFAFLKIAEYVLNAYKGND